MTAVFDAYVVVDWSAEARPKTGADSIWLAIYERGRPERVSNPPTRDAAMAELVDALSDLAARGLTVLVGCDFAFGFPAGFAAGLGAGDWKGVWRRLEAEISDGADNANNRFQVAARLNELLSGQAAPFWGCPPTADFAGLAERRLAEQRLPTTKSVWQIFYNGSVGGQSLVGIPHLARLRRHPWIADFTRIWPFETGLVPLQKSSDWRILLAEIYPSLLPRAGGDIKDRAQSVALAHWFAAEDAAGRLSALFAGDPTLTAAERDRAEREEGWILGAGAQPAVTAWVKDPAEIYRRSFATIQSEIGLDSIPLDMRDLVVRVVHACGMTDILPDLAWSQTAAAAGRAALAAGAPILVDAEMVAHGIIARRLPLGNRVICTLGDPAVARTAQALGTTRSATAVDLWPPMLDGAIVAIGNAPTALFRLLELMEEGAPRPALVLGFPVGFVGAAESKEALAASDLPFITLRGRRGGSAMAAAAVNALAGGLE